MVYLSKCQYAFTNSQRLTMLLFILYTYILFFVDFRSILCMTFWKILEL